MASRFLESFCFSGESNILSNAAGCPKGGSKISPASASGKSSIKMNMSVGAYGLILAREQPVRTKAN